MAQFHFSFEFPSGLRAGKDSADASFGDSAFAAFVPFSLLRAFSHFLPFTLFVSLTPFIPITQGSASFDHDLTFFDPSIAVPVFDFDLDFLCGCQTGSHQCSRNPCQ